MNKLKQFKVEYLIILLMAFYVGGWNFTLLFGVLFTIYTIYCSGLITYLISRDGDLAFDYAKYIIRGRWQPGEKAILQSKRPDVISGYIDEVIKGRWAEYEEYIANNIDYYLNYWWYSDVLHAYYKKYGRVDIIEEKIKNDARLLYLYAVKIMGARWPEPEFENIIKYNKTYAIKYAFELIHERWLEAEPTICKSDPESACNYAIYLIKGRWPEAEETIKQDVVQSKRYLEYLDNINNFDIKLKEITEHKQI